MSNVRRANVKHIRPSMPVKREAAIERPTLIYSPQGLPMPVRTHRQVSTKQKVLAASFAVLLPMAGYGATQVDEFFDHLSAFWPQEAEAKPEPKTYAPMSECEDAGQPFTVPNDIEVNKTVKLSGFPYAVEHEWDVEPDEGIDYRNRGANETDHIHNKTLKLKFEKPGNYFVFYTGWLKDGRCVKGRTTLKVD